ncbi:MAG: sulfurtransferase [Vicinamibacteria bacterium]
MEIFAAVLMLAGLAQGAPAAAEPSVSAGWLREHLDDPGLVLLHVGPKAAFESGHVPGAQLVLPGDLAVPRAEGALQLQLLPPDALREKLELLGVGDASRVVVYAAEGWITPATRVLFALDAGGVGERASLLEGGLEAWKAAGFPVSAELRPRARAELHARPRPELVADLDAVKASLGAPGVAIVDARLERFFSGADPGSMPRAGHIPGARSLPFSSLLRPDGGLRDDAELAAAFRASGVGPNDAVISYCHIGQQATLVYLVAKRLGHPARVYDGSWEEWSRSSELPIAIQPPGERAKD